MSEPEPCEHEFNATGCVRCGLSIMGDDPREEASKYILPDITDEELAEMKALCDGPMPRERDWDSRTGLEKIGIDLVYVSSISRYLLRCVTEIEHQRAEIERLNQAIYMIRQLWVTLTRKEPKDEGKS